MSDFPTTKKKHWDRIARLGCLITGQPATIHHVHGRSVGARLQELGLSSTKGMSQRGYGDALVIPLAAELHYLGSKSIDGGGGVQAWEDIYGSQAEHVDAVSRSVGYDLWGLHRLWCASRIFRRNNV